MLEYSRLNWFFHTQNTSQNSSEHCENKDSISHSWLPCDVIPPLKTIPNTLNKGGFMVERIYLYP